MAKDRKNNFKQYNAPSSENFRLKLLAPSLIFYVVNRITLYLKSVKRFTTSNKLNKVLKNSARLL